MLDEQSALLITMNGNTSVHLDMLNSGIMYRLLQEKWKAFARVSPLSIISIEKEDKIVTQNINCSITSNSSIFQGKFYRRLLFAILYLLFFSLAIYYRPRDLEFLRIETSEEIVRLCLICFSISSNKTKNCVLQKKRPLPEAFCLNSFHEWFFIQKSYCFE